jgi:hypothetical protein
MRSYNLSAEIKGWQTFTDVTPISDGAVFIYVVPRETVGNFTGTTAFFSIRFSGGDYTMTYVRQSNMIFTQYANQNSDGSFYNIFQDKNLVATMEMSSAYDTLTTYVNGESKGVNKGYFGGVKHASATAYQPAASSGSFNVTLLVFSEAERAKAKIVAEELRNADGWRFLDIANQVMNRVIPATPPPIHIPKLSLYHPLIYCDDSDDMRQEDRYEYQIELAKRIALIATKILPGEMHGVDLRFINNDFSKQVPATEIEQAMKEVKPSGRANIGTNLRKRVLEPFVYKLITKPVVPGTPLPFRPLLVCIITCGAPEPEDANALRDEIVMCKKNLMKSGCDPTAVKFCISQVGPLGDAAMEFIDGLRDEKDIEDVIYCTVEQLVSYYKELQDNEKALELWLLRTLTTPIISKT